MKRKLFGIQKLIFLCSVFSLFIFSNSVHAQIDKFKAAYIYNICKFVEWPKAARQGDFVIGIVGNQNVANATTLLAKKKKMLGRKIVVKYYFSANKVEKCHVMFVGVNQTDQLPQAIAKAGKNATLFIAEKNGAIGKGAAINFIIKGKKLKFEIKKANATRQNLKINPRINKLAAKVY